MYVNFYKIDAVIKTLLSYAYKITDKRKITRKAGVFAADVVVIAYFTVTLVQLLKHAFHQKM